MAFLAKIRNYIKRYKNRDFRTSIQKEKQGKYLLPTSVQKAPRKKWKIFKKQTKRLTPFSRFVQEKIATIQHVGEKKQKILGYIGVFLISASLYIVVYSSYFDITPSKVLIEDITDGIDVSIAYRTVEDLYGRNLFLINSEEIALSLKKYQQNISHITIDRLYPNGMKILLESHPIIFTLHVFSIPDKEWGVSDNGVVIPKSKIKTLPPMVLDYIGGDSEDENIIEYKELMSESSASYISQVLDYMKQNWGDLKIHSLQYFQTENELHISLENGVKILFTLKDFSKQDGNVWENIFLKNEILNLKTYIENNKKDIMDGNFSYIDARIPGKIFVCKDKVVCKKNLFLMYGDYYK